jgi:hypothetical protein
VAERIDLNFESKTPLPGMATTNSPKEAEAPGETNRFLHSHHLLVL